MRDPKRIKKICSLLEKAWSRYPDLRLGQFLENWIFARGTRGDDTIVKLFYQEDSETTHYIKDFIKEHLKEEK